MIKKSCFFTFCFLTIAALAVEEKPSEIEMTDKKDTSELLLQASHRYIGFINRISVGEAFPQLKEAATLIAPDCKKVFNGSLFTKNREEFVADLLSVYENHGSWKMIPIEVIPVPSDNIAVLRIFVETERFGTNTAIVILRYDANYLITEINEVFSPVKSSYDF